MGSLSTSRSLTFLTRTPTASSTGSTYPSDMSGYTTPTTPTTPPDSTTTPQPTPSYFSSRSERTRPPTSYPTSDATRPAFCTTTGDTAYDSDYISVVESELTNLLGEYSMQDYRQITPSDIHSEMQDPWTRKLRGTSTSRITLNKADKKKLDKFQSENPGIVEGWKEGLRSRINADEERLKGYLASYDCGQKPWET